MSESKLQACSGLKKKKKKQFLACPSRPLLCSGSAAQRLLSTIKLKLAETFACARWLTGRAHFNQQACLPARL